MAELNFESEELKKVNRDVFELKGQIDVALNTVYSTANEIKDNLEESSQLRPSLNQIIDTIDKLKQSIDANLEKNHIFLSEQMQQYEIDTDDAVKKIDEAISYIESFTKNISISNA